MKTAGSIVLTALFFTTTSFAESFTMGQQVVHQFTTLCQAGKYQQAADECLADNVYFASPKFTYKSKQEWLQKFPSFHQKNVATSGNDNNNGPMFDALIEAVSDKVFVRRGKAKILGWHISVKETIELNEQGKIIRSVLQKA